MKLHIKCIPCFLNQALRAVEVTKRSLSTKEKKQLLNQLMEILGDDTILEKIPAITGKAVYGTIGDFVGDPDIYKDIKRQSNELAVNLVPTLENIVDASEHKLKTAANIAIVGNLIDLGANLEYDLEHEINQLSLAVDHFSLLEQDLENANEILYCGDNAGEIYFDKIFIKEIKREYPSIDIKFATRAGPVINDATIQDASEAGLDQYTSLIESSHSPGVILEQTSVEFQDIFARADIIISKGQGNFECLSDQPKDINIYFMLKVKCDIIEEIFNVPVGSSILAHWKEL